MGFKILLHNSPKIKIVTLTILFVGLTEEEAEALAAMKMEKLKDDADASKGFVISFDDDTPKKPKPMLKQRRMSNKKNSIVTEMSSDGSNSSRKENVPPEVMICIVSFFVPSHKFSFFYCIRFIHTHLVIDYR